MNAVEVWSMIAQATNAAVETLGQMARAACQAVTEVYRFGQQCGLLPPDPTSRRDRWVSPVTGKCYRVACHGNRMHWREVAPARYRLKR